MKTYHFALLFSLIFVIVIAMLNFRGIPDKALIEEQQIIDEAVDRSVWSAMSEAASKYSASADFDRLLPGTVLKPRGRRIIPYAETDQTVPSRDSRD